MLGTSLLWRSTVAFTYLKVKSAKCLCLLQVVLVLSFWSWSWSCKQRSWSWSCYFGLGLGLGLKNLVLFTSLSNDVWVYRVHHQTTAESAGPALLHIKRVLFWRLRNICIFSEILDDPVKLIITFAKEVKFSPALVCLFVDWCSQNSVEAWHMSPWKKPLDLVGFGLRLGEPRQTTQHCPRGVRGCVRNDFAT